MNLMKLSELKGRDVYEFSYFENYNMSECSNHWSDNSLYISDEEFSTLSKSIDNVIENFNYYGPNKVHFSQWNEIKEQFKNNNLREGQKDIEKFFSEIDIWLNSNQNKSEYFWILGL